MSSLNEYQNLGKSLGDYAKGLRTNSGANGLQEAFKPGGKMYDTIQMLNDKENLINSYDQELKRAVEQNNLGGISLEEANKRTAENKIELEEIKLLKDRLAELSSSVSRGTSGFAASRAVNEFSDGVAQHKKVSQGGVFIELCQTERKIIWSTM